MRPVLILAVASATAILAAYGLQVRADHLLHAQVVRAAPAEQALPARVLWVWERPEDLRQVNPAITAVAVLETTLRLGAGLDVVPRRQPLVLPVGVTRIAVVRIESGNAFAAHHDDDAMLAAAVRHLRHAAEQPGVAALQVDFDARRSERRFYGRLLSATRRAMPAGMPLEMTALASWCSNDDWIAGLPVNSATPMFFRMEPDRRLRSTQATEFRVSEPLCRSSLGVSTTEPWPADTVGKRTYLFADRGWKQDVAWLAASTKDEDHP